MADRLRAAITGIGATVPAKVMTNLDFAEFLDTSDEWITKRTGIKQRHLVGDGESTATLAVQAARNALDDAGLTADDLDLIVCATVSPEMIFPSTACFVQDAIGAGNIPAFDISAACSGFIYALTVGSQFVETGKYKRVMVIGADALSRFADFTDRSSCILFGDAAGAVILEPTEDPDRGVQYTTLHTDGSGWDFLYLPGGANRHPATHETVDDKLHYVKMRGREVYKFAVEKMQWLLGNCMDECGLTTDDVDMVIPHQVNIRIIESAAGKFHFPMEKVFVNIDRYGNTSAASIPLALLEARETGKVSEGSTLLMVAFGAGLTWAGAVVRL